MRKLFFSFLLGCIAIGLLDGQNPADSVRHFYNRYLQAKLEGDFLLAEGFLDRILENDSLLSNYQNALVRNNRGYIYFETGRFNEAQEEYRMSEGLVPGLDSRSIQLRISIHNNQGLVYSGRGDYTNSLEYYNEAERLLGLILEWDSISYSKQSTLLLNKGIALFHLGKFEESKGVLKECAQIKEKHKHPYLGSVYFNLGRVYELLEDPELARENYLKGIGRWTVEYDSDYYELANIYLHFGQFLAACGQAEEGLVYLQKALQNYKRNYGSGHPLTAACYENLARYSLDQEHLEDALDYLQEALHSLENSGHDLTLLKILATKTEALETVSVHSSITDEKLEYLQAALTTNSLSIDVLHRIQSAFLSTESRIFMTSRQKDLFTTGIRLNLEMYKLNGDKAYIDEAFLMAAKGKSGELMFEMNNKEWLYLESLTDTMAISAAELKQQIAHLSNLIQTKTMALNPDSAQLDAWQNQLFQTRDSFKRHMEKLRRDFPQIGHFELSNIDISMKQIRQNLNRNETLVEYFMTGAEGEDKEQLFIFVVSKNECHYYQSPVDSLFYQNLETVLDKLHAFVPYNETREQFDSLKFALFGIYQDLIQPVESQFRGKNLLIVPDETLSFVPFDALITHLDSDTIINYAGMPYLLQDYNISYMYNSQLINRKRSWDLRFPNVTAWIPEQSEVATFGFGKLQGAMEEVQDIMELVKGRSIQKSLEKPELVSLLEENSIIHLAMHSLATENMGKSPYFILDTIRDPFLGNRMHDYEINALHLSTPMVVLSSCETAGGLLHDGEGIMSLSRSFLQAGASSVVHTLWPVEDAKSREIMVAYYGEIKKGHSKSKALSNVKKQYMLEQPPFYTHPYYWAAFQITGDTSPLHSKRRVSYIIGSFLIALSILYYLKRRSFFRRA